MDDEMGNDPLAGEEEEEEEEELALDGDDVDAVDPEADDPAVE